jgi:hypothetical protein
VFQASHISGVMHKHCGPDSPSLGFCAPCIGRSSLTLSRWHHRRRIHLHWYAWETCGILALDLRFFFRGRDQKGLARILNKRHMGNARKKRIPGEDTGLAPSKKMLPLAMHLHGYSGGSGCFFKEPFSLCFFY